MPHVSLEALHRLGISLDLNLDAAVREILNPPVETFAGRCGFRKEPETDSLNTPADDIPPGNEHRACYNKRVQPETGRT